MSDKFDDMLFNVAGEADSCVDYAAIKLAAQAAAKAERQRRMRIVRYSSVAAGFVVLLGIGAMFATGGFGRAKSAARADVPMAAMVAAGGINDAAAPAPEAAIEEPACANDGMPAEEDLLLGTCFDGGANDENGSYDDTSTSTTAGTDGMNAAPDIAPIGEVSMAELSFPEDGADKSVTCVAIDGAGFALETGEAQFTADEDSVTAVWRINDDEYVSVDAAGYSRDELCDMLASLCD